MINEKNSEVPDLVAIQLSRETEKVGQRRKAIELLTRRPANWIYLLALMVGAGIGQYAFRPLPYISGAFLMGMFMRIIYLGVQVNFLQRRLDTITKLVLENSVES
ncbi:hypothetical protein BH11PSE11_BH11PSE11_25110 [soil metagenome]